MIVATYRDWKSEENAVNQCKAIAEQLKSLEIDLGSSSTNSNFAYCTLDLAKVLLLWFRHGFAS